MDDPQIVAPDGEIDIATVGAFREQIAAAAATEPAALVIDLSAVSFIDSSGLGAVVEANDRARRAGRAFAVVAPHGSAPAVTIGLAGLRGTLPLFDSRDDIV